MAANYHLHFLTQIVFYYRGGVILENKKQVSYLCIQSVFFIVIKCIELFLSDRTVGLTKYAFILVNLIFLLLFYLQNRQNIEGNANILALAIGMTFFGDLFLILIPALCDWPYYSLGGYISFSILEFIIALYLGLSKRYAIIFSVFFAVTNFVVWMFKLLDVTNEIALINLSLLAANMITGWLIYNKNKTSKNLLFALGMTCFFGCDYSIAVRIIFEEIKTVHDVADYLVWLFYMPALVLLVLSYIKSAKSDKIAE